MPRPILTANQMRAAERAAIDRGVPETTLMERAGQALAAAIARFSGARPTLMLCGPGNNGGDGYVAARALRDRGFEVTVAALAEPATETARWARGGWDGEVVALADAPQRPLVVDCLFGTGLARPLEPALAARLRALVEGAAVAVACDLPSGVSSDDGKLFSPVAHFDLTVTFGALKPAHRLMPAMEKMGRVVLDRIGIDSRPGWHEIGTPELPGIAPDAHKFTRGMVHALAGMMPGAIALSARAAQAAGAGYVRVSTSLPIEGLPDSIVQTGEAQLGDERIGCIIVGPGLGDLPVVLTLALTSKAPKLIDADAIRAVGEPGRLKGQDCILTPHEGEFKTLFGELEGSKAERAAAAAQACSNVVVYKGPDTIVAAPDGRVGFAPPAPAWLASAGTGDVLTGIIAAFRARGMDPFDAACAGVWVHGRAAQIAGPAMNADDLIAAIPEAMP